MKKRILFISPKFFDYEKRIIKQFEKSNYEVTFFDDRPKLTVLGKGLMRLFPFIFKSKVKKYFNSKILKCCQENEFDYVFVILGQSFSREMFEQLRKYQNKSIFILYLWDSIKNFPQCLELSKAFDKIYSFDRQDVNEYHFDFLSLFFCKKDNNLECDKKFDLSCVCTIKKGKYKKIKFFKDSLNDQFNCYFYLYLQSKIVFWYYKIFDKDFRKAKLDEFKFEKISYEQNIDLSKNSRIVLDVQMKNQNGLTMRTFETLALHTKLITTNSRIKEYNFYDHQNIFVYNDNMEECLKFIKSSLPFKIMEVFENEYSIENWVNRIIE